MKWEGRRKSGNLEDRRGMSNKGKAVAGGGLIAIVVILLQLFGGETGQTIAPILEQVTRQQQTTQQVQNRELTPEEVKIGDFVATILADTEDAWHHIFRENNLGTYKEPKLILFNDQVASACGNATSAVGPFYCPADQNAYMDLVFFNELHTRFGAKRGDFAIAYVTAHEIGHHVQTLLGTSQKVRQLQSQMSKAEANRLSVALELQADFYAGLWAHYVQGYLTENDIEVAISAAQAVGDDAIQKRVRGQVQPESFTHGTSAQRKEWFLKGLRTGDFSQHDTFSALLN